MVTFPGYKIAEKIYEHDRLRIYRGQRAEDQLPVFIKVLQAGSNPVEVAKLLNEFEITRNLDIKGILKPMDLAWSGMTAALIFEDNGDVRLRTYFKDRRPDLQDFFVIATQLAEILGNLHQHGVTHRNLRLDNIYMRGTIQQVNIADFCMAVLLFRKGQNELMTSLEGSMAYMSPEQIGRTGKSIDHRSDFYSLGIVFYELLTGQLPLQAGSHMQWVHAHMAKKPVCPEEVNPDIPPVLSAIIMKLLAKSAGERYQSAAGLLADLAECRRQWNETGTIKDFLPGEKDLSDRFQLPRKLYGRQKETALIQTAFAQACSGQNGLLLVHGYAGRGKTVLVNETLKPMTAKKGYFITGKSDQLQWNIPYVPFIKAVGDLIRQILTESPDNLALWKKRLLRALGRSGAVVTEVIPDVELIIGPQPPVETLQLWESQNRFMMVFRDFIRVFAQKEHPLVIFMDDLQWADPASLGLIRCLSEDTEIHYLLLIGAYRDNEVTGTHPLIDTLEKLKKSTIPVRQMLIPPLNQEHTNQFVADALHCTKEQSKALADILYCKSAGNPFFLGQLLLSAHEENLLNFSTQDGYLEWDADAISKMSLTDDVINFMLGKLQKLPEETLKVIKLAACIGNDFDLKTLSLACCKPPGQTVADLWPAIVESLVLIINPDKAKKTYRIADNYPVVDVATNYVFLHDRVQQAAYSLIPEGEKKEVHVRIGRLLLLFTAQDLLDENIFMVMDHLNRGLDLIEEREERIRLAEYNLLAGRKAKAQTAFDAAMRYFKFGTGLLPDDAWSDYYRLAFDLFLELAYCEYLCAHHDTAERLFDMLLDKAETDLERADIYVGKILLHSSRGKYFETLELGAAGLRMLGVHLPAKPGKVDFIKESLLVRWCLYKQKSADLTALPALIDQRQKRVMLLLLTLAAAACMVRPDLFAFIILKMSRLSLELGRTEFLPLGYAGYSYYAGTMLQDVKTRDEFAQKALKQVEQYAHSATLCIVYFVLGALVSHWTASGKTGLAYLQKAVDFGLESENLLVASYARGLIIENKFLGGTSLDELYRECQSYHKGADTVRLSYYKALIEKILGMSGQSGMPGSRKDPQKAYTAQSEGAHLLPHSTFDERLPSDDDVCNAMKKGEINNAVTFMVLNMQLHYLNGDYESVLSIAKQVHPNLDAISGSFLSAAYVFYYALAIAANEKGFRRYRRQLTRKQQQLKAWADACPVNFLHKYLLVSAETARADGKDSEAMLLYDQAVQSAHAHGYVQDEALTSELAGRFYAARGQQKVARVYLSEACYAYNHWGATQKIRLLQEQYPHLLANVVLENDAHETAEILKDAVQVTGRSEKTAVNDLELYAVRTAVHKMAEETDPRTLLHDFLEIAIEQAGADKGYLILEKDETLCIEAAQENDVDTAVFMEPMPLEKNVNLSLRIVRYVARTLEVGVVNDEDHLGVFARDPYLMQHQARSVVCLPLLCRDIPVGVLYLENTQMAGVFTPERVEMLQFLSSQIAYMQKLQSFLEENTFETNAERPKPPLAPLTERELEVLGLIAEGMSNKEIARVLFLTVNTVKTHVLKIYEKLQANRRVQAIARARELKILKSSI